MVDRIVGWSLGGEKGRLCTGDSDRMARRSTFAGAGEASSRILLRMLYRPVSLALALARRLFLKELSESLSFCTGGSAVRGAGAAWRFFFCSVALGVGGFFAASRAAALAPLLLRAGTAARGALGDCSLVPMLDSRIDPRNGFTPSCLVLAGASRKDERIAFGPSSLDETMPFVPESRIEERIVRGTSSRVTSTPESRIEARIALGASSLGAATPELRTELRMVFEAKSPDPLSLLFCNVLLAVISGVVARIDFLKPDCCLGCCAGCRSRCCSCCCSS